MIHHSNSSSLSKKIQKEQTKSTINMINTILFFLIIIFFAKLANYKRVSGEVTKNIERHFIQYKDVTIKNIEITKLDSQLISKANVTIQYKDYSGTIKVSVKRFVKPNRYIVIGANEELQKLKNSCDETNRLIENGIK